MIKKLFVLIFEIIIFNIFFVNILFSETSHKFYWNLQTGKRIESVKTADVEYYEAGRRKIYQFVDRFRFQANFRISSWWNTRTNLVRLRSLWETSTSQRLRNSCRDLTHAS